MIGALNGYAIGMGLGLALSTDLRIAADDARFQVTQIKRGLFADYGLGHLLPRHIGQQRALELMLTGRMIDAQEALELGLVLDVAPKEELLDAALELAERVASGPPLGIAATKRVTYMGDNDDLQRVMDWTSLAIGHMFNSEDNAEGIRSFTERREPVFPGPVAAPSPHGARVRPRRAGRRWRGRRRTRSSAIRRGRGSSGCGRGGAPGPAPRRAARGRGCGPARRGASSPAAPSPRPTP